MSSPVAAPPAAPLHRQVPPAGSSAASEAIDLADAVGLSLDPWQQAALTDALAERADGQWAGFEVGLICPRQNGKGAILEARELAGLFLFGEELILHSAHEFKTAAEAFRRVLALVQSSPDLEGRVMRVRTSHGDEGIELKSGQRLRFVARSTGSGRGFSGDCVILDEAYNLSDRALSALLPTMSARPNPQLWYTSSAPLPSAESEVLRRICTRGREGDPALVFLEYAARSNDLDDRHNWAAANPALGIRISAEFIERERATLTDDDFARERLGLWLTEADLHHRAIPEVDWSACADLHHKPTGRLAYALDVAPNGSSAAVAASDGTHLEVVACRPGTSWVVDACTAKADRFDEIVLDPAGPAGALVVPLENAGIVVRQVTTREHVQACGAFVSAVVDRTARHIAQPELDAAVANADRREIGDGGWLWSRKRSSVDISPLVAVTLARWVASQGAGEPDFFVI